MHCAESGDDGVVWGDGKDSGGRSVESAKVVGSGEVEVT
jgi:hypothetical protein